jgi:hypothetical protein
MIPLSGADRSIEHNLKAKSLSVKVPPCARDGAS